MKSKMKLWKKIMLIFVAIVLLAIILLTVIFFNTLRTILSIEKISDIPVYRASYYGDYALDEYLEHGAADSEELRDFLTDNLAKGAGKLVYGDHGCSAFLGTTPDGDIIFARNLDTSGGEGCILQTDNTEGSRMLAMSNLGWILEKPKDDLNLADKASLLAAPYVITDGMNEYGLATAVFSAGGSQSDIDKNKITLQENTVPAFILNKAKNVDEAVALLTKYNISMAGFSQYQYMICDESGNSAVIEFVNGKMQVVYKDGTYQICSNFILYDNPSMKGFGKDRYENYDDVLSKTKGVISTEDALKLLQKNTIYGDEQWSVVYNLTDKTLSATFYGEYDKVYEYSFNN